MRKLANTLFLVVISLAATTAVAPRAEALPQYQIETYYYNYGSNLQYFDGSEISTCGGYSWQWGDRTPHDGELKHIVTMECQTYDITEEWYRYYDLGCGYTGWEWIPYPVYYYSPAIC